VKLKAGKLPPELLDRLLNDVPADDPRVALGPRVGEDAALIDFGDRYLAAKTDPITFATDLIGWYLVQVNCNDLAVMGATPKWLMATLLLPEGIEDSEVVDIFGQLTAAATVHGITLIGGHTEVTVGLPRPIAVGVLLGEADKADVVLTSGVLPGDAIVLTGGIAIEGTALLAREAEEQLVNAGVEPATIVSAAQMLFEPGISVRKAAETARKAVPIHGMHDPTEGGLATGLAEMAAAGGVGITVNRAAIDILPHCLAITGALGLDPMGLIASGALLAAVASDDAATLLAALEAEGIKGRVIGRATGPEEGLRMRVGTEVVALPTFERDEIARYFASQSG
jgi:hydrogenase expression/formation protein HypE